MTMLQFSGIFINLSVRHTTRVPLWCTTQQLVTAYSTISNPELEPLGDNSNVTPEKVNFIFILIHIIPNRILILYK